MLVYHHNRRVTESVDGRRKRKEKERTAFSHEYLNDRNQHAGFYPDNFLHQAQPPSLASFRADRPDKLRKDKLNTLSTLCSLFPFRRRSVSMFRATNNKRDRYVGNGRAEWHFSKRGRSLYISRTMQFASVRLTSPTATYNRSWPIWKRDRSATNRHRETRLPVRVHHPGWLPTLIVSSTRSIRRTSFINTVIIASRVTFET